MDHRWNAVSSMTFRQLISLGVCRKVLGSIRDGSSPSWLLRQIELARSIVGRVERTTPQAWDYRCCVMPTRFRQREAKSEPSSLGAFRNKVA